MMSACTCTCTIYSLILCVYSSRNGRVSTGTLNFAEHVIFEEEKKIFSTILMISNYIWLTQITRTTIPLFFFYVVLDHCFHSKADAVLCIWRLHNIFNWKKKTTSFTFTDCSWLLLMFGHFLSRLKVQCAFMYNRFRFLFFDSFRIAHRMRYLKFLLNAYTEHRTSNISSVV